jgi:hypothetical protein
MEKHIPLIISVTALVYTIVNTAYARRRDTTKDTAADEKRITQLDDTLQEACDDLDKLTGRLETLSTRMMEVEGKLKVLDKQVDLFWGTVQRHMANLIAPDKP